MRSHCGENLHDSWNIRNLSSAITLRGKLPDHRRSETKSNDALLGLGQSLEVEWRWSGRCWDAGRSTAVRCPPRMANVLTNAERTLSHSVPHSPTRFHGVHDQQRFSPACETALVQQRSIQVEGQTGGYCLDEVIGRLGTLGKWEGHSPPSKSLNGCAGLALVFPVPLSARTFRLQEGKGSGLWDTVVGSDSLDSDLTCLILR